MENIVNRSSINFKSLAKIFVGSIIMAVSSQMYIPLPFVNITCQTLAVVLLSLFFKEAPFIMLLFIFEGLIGVPVFTGWKSGFPVIIGPTGGYMIGFVFASYFITFLNKNLNLLQTILVSLVGLIIIYFFGLLQLSLILPLNKVLEVGLYPFVFGEAIKMVVASILYIKVKKYV
jgi:biotin transport system substrate-specific component